jgi:hypothetical protein
MWRLRLDTSALSRSAHRSYVCWLAFAVVSCSAGPHAAPKPLATSTTPQLATENDTSRRVAISATAASNTTAPAPSPPQRPAYDLTADRTARIELAKTELGPRAPVELVDPIFVVAGGGAHRAATLQQPIALIRNALAAYTNHRFTIAPTVAISIYLFPDLGSYHAYCQKHYDKPCISRFGFYEPSERKMVMNGAGGTLTHELVHPMVEADFPDAPTWLNEGIASLFEQPIIPKPGEIHGGKNWRYPRLRSALGSTGQGLEARPSGIIGMSNDVFRGANEDLHYAAARYLCQWLDERNQLWSFYQHFRDHFAEDASGAKSFEAVTGLTPENANDPWTRWVRAL